MLTSILVLSDLGRKAYTHYWSTTLARTILSSPSKRPLTVSNLVESTYIVPEDIVATLQAMDVLETRQKKTVINKARVRAWAEKWGVELKGRPVEAGAFVVRVREGTGSGGEEA